MLWRHSQEKHRRTRTARFGLDRPKRSPFGDPSRIACAMTRAATPRTRAMSSASRSSFPSPAKAWRRRRQVSTAEVWRSALSRTRSCGRPFTRTAADTPLEIRVTPTNSDSQRRLAAGPRQHARFVTWVDHNSVDIAHTPPRYCSQLSSKAWRRCLFHEFPACSFTDESSSIRALPRPRVIHELRAHGAVTKLSCFFIKLSYASGMLRADLLQHLSGDPT
jgi:hypothetical protein